MGDILGLDSLLGLIITLLGFSMVLGNGYALYRNWRGMPVPGVGHFRRGRTWFLAVVGLVILGWGLASMFTDSSGPAPG